jgi:hypothetical protein
MTEGRKAWKERTGRPENTASCRACQTVNRPPADRDSGDGGGGWWWG